MIFVCIIVILFLIYRLWVVSQENQRLKTSINGFQAIFPWHELKQELDIVRFVKERLEEALQKRGKVDFLQPWNTWAVNGEKLYPEHARRASNMYDSFATKVESVVSTLNDLEIAASKKYAIKD